MMSPGGLMRVAAREGERGRGGEGAMLDRRDGETESGAAGASGNVKLKVRGAARGIVSVRAWGGGRTGQAQAAMSIEGDGARASANTGESGSTGIVRSTLVVVGVMTSVLSTEYPRK